ncbi:MAG: hypothetical protein IIV54_05430 [Bacteroidaceae bacterium]|nr:hypothetical protein [Bacteroidaceae bacterium]MBQ5729815.1 hypothetical protein [Bacteroidaceae bacterium]
MRKLVFLLLSVFYINVCAYASTEYIVNEKLVFHKLEVLETGTEKVLDSFSNFGGMIIDATIEKQNYLAISIPEVHTYTLQIVNKVVDTSQKNIKIVMYQGGEHIENMGTYTANIFFVYDLSKNRNVPELVRLEINNSPNIMLFSGIIKLSN